MLKSWLLFMPTFEILLLITAALSNLADSKHFAFNWRLEFSVPPKRQKHCCVSFTLGNNFSKKQLQRTLKLTENYLTYDWKERRKIVWHNKEIHSLKIGACFQVTKGVSYLSNFFATTHNKCLKMYIKKKKQKNTIKHHFLSCLTQLT